MVSLSEDVLSLKSHISRALDEANQCDRLFSEEMNDLRSASGVLLLLGQQGSENGSLPEPCLILNKRSRNIRQPGDLCCPGGRVSPRLDSYIAKLLPLPGFPLGRWPYWARWRARCPREARWLALLLATSLRESLEEMRLNPLSVQFLGVLPSHRLLMFRRTIHPMVGWVSGQKRFFPNWEVEKIVSVPLRKLLDPGYYARYRLHIAPEMEQRVHRKTEDYPCFLHQEKDETELLWGATYRIVTLFLKLVFGFIPPPLETLPIVPGMLNESYLNQRG